MPTSNGGTAASISPGLGRARFETLLRDALPSAASSATQIFDSCFAALRAANFTPPPTIFSSDTAPANMFNTMRNRVFVSVGLDALKVVAKTILLAVAGGAVAVLAAEALGISVTAACVAVAIVGLIWWAGGVQGLLEHLAEVLDAEVIRPIREFGR